MQAVHEVTGHIHRDLKPANFRMHNGRVVLTDFGLVKPWFKDGRHVPFEKNQPLEGTLTFASMWTHEGVSQSRRDDLEMLGYSILQLLGPDPKQDFWPSLPPGLSMTELNLYYYQRKCLLLNHNSNPRYNATIDYIRQVQQLDFYAQPNYMHFKGLLTDLFRGEREAEKKLKDEEE